MRLWTIALIALAGGVFGAVQGVSRELDGIWARVLIPGIAAGVLAGTVSWILGQKVRTIALIALACGVFGAVQGASRELDSIWARVLIPGIAAGVLAGMVSWILGRGVKR